MRSLMVFLFALFGGLTAIIAASILVSKVLGPELAALGSYGVILSSAIWAAVDSERVGLRNYKSGIAYKPLTLAVLIAFLWIIGFPWYVMQRDRIRSGRATPV